MPCIWYFFKRLGSYLMNEIINQYWPSIWNLVLTFNMLQFLGVYWWELQSIIFLKVNIIQMFAKFVWNVSFFSKLDHTVCTYVHKTVVRNFLTVIWQDYSTIESEKKELSYFAPLWGGGWLSVLLNKCIFSVLQPGSMLA